MAAEPWDDAEH